jgi:hypothetical protein
MADETMKRGRDEAAGRRERQAAALRANLKRRKEQARAREAAPDAPPSVAETTETPKP